MSTLVKVTVVIVSYNTVELLRRCLRSLRLGGVALQVVVVDNGSRDGSPEMVRAEFPEAELVESGANRGFAFATNIGLERAVGQKVAWLNSDCEVPGDAWATMVDYLEAHPEVGAVGPRLVHADGRQQPSAQAFPTPARMFVRTLGVRALMRSPRLRGWLRPVAERMGGMASQYVLAFERDRDSRSVDWISGAFLMAPAKIARQVGPLDEGYFMYCEDTDWCQRVRASGYQVHYMPSIEVLHHVGGSSAGSPFVAYQHERSLLRYFMRWQPRSFRRWRPWLALGFALRAFASELHRLFGGPAHPWWRLHGFCWRGAVPEDPFQ